LIKTDDWNPIYWWLNKWKFVWYKNFCENSNFWIKDWLLDKLNNNNFKQYLLSFSTFVKTWIINYFPWVAIDEFSLNTWKDRKNILWLVTAIENYNHKSLVEPELIFFLKDLRKNKTINYEDFINLSLEFFGKEFWMDKMTLDFVESFVGWWEATMSWFIWKAFPNDNDLSDRVWNSIILKASEMPIIVENSVWGLKKLFWEDYIIDKEKLYNEVLKEVTYHEFWHSLFAKWNKVSEMEEAKATLFYYLKIFKENNEKKYEKEDISIIIEFTIMDSIRNLERISQERSLKYIILTKVNLRNLFKVGLVSFEENNLKLDLDNSKFDEFLLLQKQELENIKELYELTEQEIIEADTKYLAELDNEIMPIIHKMIKIINKNKSTEN